MTDDSRVEILPAEEEKQIAPRAENFIHPLSALILVAIDSLWSISEWLVVTWIVTVPLSFLTVFIGVFCVQKYLNKDTNSKAATVAAVLAILAAVPTPITGTAVGILVLSLAGIKRIGAK